MTEKGKPAATCMAAAALIALMALSAAGCGGDKGGTTEAEQATYILRSIEIARRHSIAKYFIYEFRSSGNDDYYSEDHFGIVQRDFTPKAAYEALKMLYVGKP